ncbi:hypothetical protein [Planktosalinus lacus]|uniref:Uncharacterized protein n=1 Tax=Planktosalinus lacus TaxID=1526573 RepID=A0A8J2YB33_9FLAO|nr:hypothetical protein [Planktosalinus lacus]GGD99613.1 hypothetical protein GCM10011312_23860 [Planktosalinus lacus]
MDENFKKKILDDINISGFQTELEVASILKKNGWKVEPNTNYVDYDSNKSREIDIIAYKNPSGGSIYLELHLVVEVKKSNKPWIVFTSEFKQTFYHRYASGLLKKFANKKKGFKSNILTRKSPNSSFERIGTSYKEAFKKPNEPSKIYEALLSACKASLFRFTEEAPPKELERDPFDPNHPVEIYIYHPIIVLEGILIEAYLNEEGEIEISESDFIPVQLKYQTQKAEENEFYCDVISKQGLNKYCKKLDEWIRNIINEK